MIPNDPGDLWSWTNDGGAPAAAPSDGMRYRYGLRYHWAYFLLMGVMRWAKQSVGG